MIPYNPWILYLLYKNWSRKAAQSSRKPSHQCPLQWWPREENGEGRASRKQSQKLWRTMDTENSLRTESQEKQELSLLPGQGSHRTFPTGSNHHFGPVTIGHLSFFPLQMRGVLFVSHYQIFLQHCLLDVMRKSGQTAHFSSSLTLWREIGSEGESYLSPEILELEVDAVTGWGFWGSASPLRRQVDVFRSVVRQMQIDMRGKNGRLYSCSPNCVLSFLGTYLDCISQLALQLGVVMTNSDQRKIIHQWVPPCKFPPFFLIY